jgi:4-hydroxy-tetrahydrodipicolinate synthase
MTTKQKQFIPVMLTPFKNDGSIDYDGLTELTEFYLNAGAGGLFANCQSSEMFALSDSERLSITQHVVKIANGQVPVVATGTFGGPVTKQAEFVKQMHATGVEAVIIITNMLADEHEPAEIFDDRFYSLLRSTDNIPLGFYECPQPYKRVLSADQLAHFVETGRIIYHKDTCLDIVQIREKLRATSHVINFGLYDAYMAHAVESLRAGSAGLSCIQGNYSPELVVWLCKYYDDASRAEEVERVQQFFNAHMDVMHSVYPAAAKYFLRKRGLRISDFTRIDGGLFDDAAKSKLDRLYDACHALLQDIEVPSVT